MKFKKKLILILITIVFLNGTCLANNVDKKEITNDLKIVSYISVGSEGKYGVYGKENEELSIDANKFNLPSNLFDYRDEIRLRITYSEVDNEVLGCKVINYITGEIIEDLSKESLNKLFNIENGKNITEKNWGKVIKLSELKENEIYKYTATSTSGFPEIENDIGKNCIIYIKEKDDEIYEKEINMYKEVSGGSISFSFNEYNSGESFCIMYKKVENDELLKFIEDDEIIYLSNYKEGDKLEQNFEDYIYNDTEKNIIIHIKNTADSVVIPKGEIYGFDWKIDSATISYTEDNSNENKVIDKNNNSSQANLVKFPNSGLETNIWVPILSSLIGILSISLIIMIKKIKKINKD